MNKNKLKVGIAGFGVVGKKRFKFIQENSHFETIAISDIKFDNDDYINKEKKIITNSKINIYNNYNKLLNEDLDILFVSLPNHLAPVATIKGLKKKCHVFFQATQMIFHLHLMQKIY